jgi:hypothetical protein
MRTDRPSTYKIDRIITVPFLKYVVVNASHVHDFSHTVCLCDPLNSQNKLRLLTYTALNFTPYNSKAVCFLCRRNEFVSIRYLEQYVLDTNKINQYSS